MRATFTPSSQQFLVGSVSIELIPHETFIHIQAIANLYVRNA